MEWFTQRTGVHLPTRPVCPGHRAPAEYLHYALFGTGDAVVWANRGGGKTLLAALASVAEQLIRPGTRTAVIGGSHAQSQRLIDSARMLIDHLDVHDRVERISASEIRFAGGGRLTAVPQSQKAVRGLHVPRIRADEVELFDKGVWNALAFVPSASRLVWRPAPGRHTIDGRARDREDWTRPARQDARPGHGDRWKSDPPVARAPCPEIHMSLSEIVISRGSPARVDYLSTAHVLDGRMSQLVATADADWSGPAHGSSRPASSPRPRLFKWCLWDVIERCPPDRECGPCPLAADCRGLAKRAEGFYSIEDAILNQARSSRPTWEAEMLCMGPRMDAVVFPEFNLDRNVVRCRPDARLPMYRAMDFGFSGLYVCLWFQVEPMGAVRVVREYARQRLALGLHAQRVLAADKELLPDGPPVRATFADPSGAAATIASGASVFSQLAGLGIHCTSRQSRINDGLELVRSRLAPAGGGTMLFIDPSCAGLIRAFQTYQWDGAGAGRTPLKNGADHYIDALRYGLVNLWGAGVERREY